MCDFPARQLLQQAYKVTEEDHDGFAQLTYACGFIKSIGDLAFYHHQLTGCRCWDEALAETEGTNG